PETHHRLMSLRTAAPARADDSAPCRRAGERQRDGPAEARALGSKRTAMLGASRRLLRRLLQEIPGRCGSAPWVAAPRQREQIGRMKKYSPGAPTSSLSLRTRRMQ